MNTKPLERLSILAATILAVLVTSACTIPLRSENSQTLSSTSAEKAFDPLGTKLAECRSVTPEQKDTLSECRKAWAEKRRQFFGRTPDSGASQDRPSVFVQPPDDGRLSPGFPPAEQPGKE